MALKSLCRFLLLGCVCCCWMQDDCVAKELPSDVRSMEILWWSDKRMSSKANK
jgi:hypothetical protein